MATPNVIAQTPGATPGRVGQTPQGGMTPAMSMTGGATPQFRDVLNLNDTSGMDEGAQMQRAKEAMLKNQLRNSLKALPAPKNEFEIDLSAAIPAEAEQEPEEATMEEDAQDLETAQKRALEREAAAERARRSSAVQRELPRPLQVNPAYGRGDAPLKGTAPLVARAEQMVLQEMLAMLHADSAAHPVPGAAPAAKVAVLPVMEDSAMAQARVLVAAELEAVRAVAGDRANSVEACTVAASKAAGDVVYLASARAHRARAALTPEQRVEALKNQHEIVASHCARDGKKAAKTEGRVVKFTAGYQKRSAVLLAESRAMLGNIAEECSKPTRSCTRTRPWGPPPASRGSRRSGAARPSTRRSSRRATRLSSRSAAAAPPAPPRRLPRLGASWRRPSPSSCFSSASSAYRGTSLIRNRPPLGPYSRTMPRALRWSQGGGRFL
ncbi:pre-mRNA splicing factor component-domain-containing protein [Baffinella frigidus]|nr:pre-mRNA splicing factor component-domain-containing protein [Cryptophyta sp. CCMP2293]